MSAEKSYTIALLGSNHELTKLIGEAFGSPGTKSDMQFYNRLDLANSCIFTAVAPIGYPEKIKVLLQSRALSRIHILIIDAETGITPEVGEIIITMDIYARHFATVQLVVIAGITEKNEWQVAEIHKKMAPFLGTTQFRDVKIMELRERDDFDKMKAEVATMGDAMPLQSLGYGKVLIDHNFPVKGVGTVVLGLVQGDIKAGEMYEMTPVLGKPKKIICRSIQKHDRDFKTAEEGDRVGLALKGIRAEDFGRDTIFATPGIFSLSDEIVAKIDVIPFYKPNGGVISPNDTKNYHIIADLGISSVKMLEGDDIKPGKSGKIKLKLDKALPHPKEGLKGVIADFGPFEKKLRIVGYFEMQ